MSDAFCDDGDREYYAVSRTVRYWTEHGMNKNHWSPYTSDRKLLKKAFRIYQDNVKDAYTPKHMKVTR